MPRRARINVQSSRSPHFLQTENALIQKVLSGGGGVGGGGLAILTTILVGKGSKEAPNNIKSGQS